MSKTNIKNQTQRTKLDPKNIKRPQINNQITFDFNNLKTLDLLLLEKTQKLKLYTQMQTTTSHL